MDVWLVRFNAEAPLHYWGFKQMGEAESLQALAAARSVLFVGGPTRQGRQSVQDILYWYPDTPVSKMQQVKAGCCRLAAGPAHSCASSPSMHRHCEQGCQPSALPMQVSEVLLTALTEQPLR